MTLFHRSVLSERLRRRVIVTLHSGETFTGVLWQEDERAWVLRSAGMFDAPNGQVTPVDGEVVILTENVAYAQTP